MNLRFTVAGKRPVKTAGDLPPIPPPWIIEKLRREKKEPERPVIRAPRRTPPPEPAEKERKDITPEKIDFEVHS